MPRPTPALTMIDHPHATAAGYPRRSLLVLGGALALPGLVAAQGTAPLKSAMLNGAPRKAAKGIKRAKAMTAAEEASAARAVAESIADETGEPMHAAVGLSPRLLGDIKLFDGQDFSEAQARGKLLLVFYWASWCPICKVVAPRLHDFWLKNRAKGVEVLALSTDTEVQPAFAYIQRAGYKYPTSMAASARLDEALAPRVLPTLMVRSKLGVIISVDEGEVEADEFKDFLVHL